MFMIDYPDNEVQLYQKYSPKKSELDEWKETALKSQFLLNQILKVTSEKKGSELIINEKFESISSMIDMIQDIKIWLVPAEGSVLQVRASIYQRQNR